jgi:hypothetical protein
LQWRFFANRCVARLQFGAEVHPDPVDNVSGALISALWRVLVLLPVMAVAWGFTEWADKPRPPQIRGTRQHLIAVGLGAAAIPSLVFVGLIWSPQTAPLGSWNNYPIASPLGFWNLPLCVVSLLLGLLGTGKGRWLLLLGAGFLVLVWSVALRHW